MKVLLDTHILLWWMTGSPQLAESAALLIADTSNTIFVSAASVWELRIKESLGKISLPANFLETLEEESFENLSITMRHADQVARLPLLHRDPFDRILVAQAQLDGLTLITKDEILSKYPVDCLIF